MLTKHKDITKDMIKRAHDQFRDDLNSAVVIPSPTRLFGVGDQVRVGGLLECVVAEILEAGKAYRIEYIKRDNNYGQPVDTTLTRCWWWFDVEPNEFASAEADNLFAGILPGQMQQSSIDSLFHIMGAGGIVCDPRYQRGYVWTHTDQERLIDSIFNRMSIGSLIFSRHAGYLHEGRGEEVTYINLDGEEITFDRENDNTVSVIDGQQRATTLWRFFTNQFTYRGRYYKDLSPSDQGNFNSTIISYRIFDEDSVPYKDVLRMFIGANMGVPQDPIHLAGVIKQLEELE